MPTVLKVGDATRLPPVAASYQVMVPPLAIAVNVCAADVSHTVWLPPLVGAAAALLIVKITAVLLKLEQLLSFDACA